MRCEKCKVELKKGAAVCPSCGKKVKTDKVDPKQANKKKGAVPQKKRLKPWHWVTIGVAAFLLVLVLTVTIWWAVMDVESFGEGWDLVCNLFDPPENNVLYKDSYSVSDKKAMRWREKVVASIGDKKLTNGVLQVYYWANVRDYKTNNNYQALYDGLDFSKPLDEQFYSDVQGKTWQHYFLDVALDNWHAYQSMALMAQASGMKLDETLQQDLNNMRQSLAQAAANEGFNTIDEMLQSDMGPGCTYDDYVAYTMAYYWGYMYFNEKTTEARENITDQMIEDYFKAHEESLKASSVTKDSGYFYDVRHILIEVEGGKKGSDGKMTYTDEEWETCRKEAQKVLDEWLDGDATDATFAEAANKYSKDAGSNANGGLYADVTKDTNFVKEFKDWYLEKDRKKGDYGLVKTEYGYHIMYLSDMEEQWVTISREAIMVEESEKIAEAAKTKYPMDVEYKKIVLGVVDLNGQK